MRVTIITITSLLAIVWAVALAAQEENTSDIRAEIITALHEISAISPTLENGMAELIPSKVLGWTCQRQEKHANAASRGLDAIPKVNFVCEHAEQSLNLTISLDPSTAAIFCRGIDIKKSGIANGRVKPDLYRFFENETWRIQRGSVDITGCAGGALALTARGSRSQAAIDRGPESIDAFAEAMLKSNTSKLLNAAEFAAQQAALNNLVELLNIQSQFLADMIPSPPEATKETKLPSMMGLPEHLRPSLPIFLGWSPTASADLNVEGCRIHIELSASRLALHEARNTGLKWGRKGGADGSISHAYMRRNTERFVGHERVNGTGIELVVDDRVIVRVVIPGAEICENDPTIVRRLVDEILAHDLSGFGTQ